MGIGIHLVEPLLREHAFRPIYGNVLTMGRQTIYFTTESVLQLMQQHGIDTGNIHPSSLELDRNTIDRQATHAERQLISDKALFRLLGNSTLRSLDRSDYEGADVICDLNLPLPAHLHGIADFIVDGSTLDNTFNPVQTLKNYCDLLAPSGRLLMLNAFSCYDTPYCIMPSMWYLDYFVVNAFQDVKVYVLVSKEGRPWAEWNSYWLDLNWLQENRRRMGRFTCSNRMNTVVFAEKAPNSTTDRYPVQQDYRSDEDWEIYCRNLSIPQRSLRPHLLRSNCDAFVPDVLGGHALIDSSFKALT